ncbi:hypothetical protein BGX33_003235 [Mortierella sp. NVP41]|nr:hypothetical protein BGX33_003235 [Mortierella sp. NVP41]
MIYPKPPNPVDPLPPSAITTDQLFSLPRIPYFYSITPYPLSVANTLNQPSSHMKRRYTLDDLPSDPSAPSRGYDSLNGIRAGQQGQQQGSEQDPSEGAGVDDGFDHFDVDMIEGRVLKKMRHIKLTSDSPPSDVPDMFVLQHQDAQSLDNNCWTVGQAGQATSTSTSEHTSRPASMDVFRSFAPIKISTRSSSRQNSTAYSLSSNLPFRDRQEDQATTDSTQSRPSDGSNANAAIYSGMNSLLHQVHASRFGIPEEEPEEAATSLIAQSGPNQTASQVQPQNPSQVLAANTTWHQQQQQSQFNAATTTWNQQPSGSNINATWNQHRALSGTQMMDEDDEMADVNETQSTNSLLASNSYRFPQGMDSNTLARQGYVLNQHPQQQQPQHPLPSQSEQAAEEHNLYHNINSQLRAAFLARSEMEKRHQ